MRELWRIMSTCYLYLEEPEHGEEEREDERHRQVRERMTTDNHADRLEKCR